MNGGDAVPGHVGHFLAQDDGLPCDCFSNRAGGHLAVFLDHAISQDPAFFPLPLERNAVVGVTGRGGQGKQDGQAR